MRRRIYLLTKLRIGLLTDDCNFFVLYVFKPELCYGIYLLKWELEIVFLDAI